MPKATYLLAGLLAFAAYAADNHVEVPPKDAPISAVTVHLGWAEITRTVTIPAGEARRLRIDKLANSLIAATVRGSGPAFVAVTADAYKAAELDTPEKAKLLQAITDAELLIEERNAELALIRKSAENFQKLIDWKTSGKADGETPRVLATAEVDALAKLNEQLAANLKAQFALNKSIADAGKQADEARKALSDHLADLPDHYGRIDVDVSANKEATSVTLTYSVAHATWRPIAEATRSADGLQVRYKAIVRQSSAVDWRGVPLTLVHSTPEPKWLAAYYTRKETKGHQEWLISRQRLSAARAAGVPNNWLTVPKATVSGAGIAALLTGPTVDFEVQSRWLLNANLADSAAASLRLRNPQAAGLPAADLRPGPIAADTLPQVPGGGSVTVALFPDDKLTVTRTPLPGSATSAGRLGGYRLTLRNDHDSERTVELREEMVGRQYLGAKPAAAVANNQLTWSITIPANSTQAVTWTYRQPAPKKKEK